MSIYFFQCIWDIIALSHITQPSRFPTDYWLLKWNRTRPASSLVLKNSVQRYRHWVSQADRLPLRFARGRTKSITMSPVNFISKSLTLHCDTCIIVLTYTLQNKTGFTRKRSKMTIKNRIFLKIRNFLNIFVLNYCLNKILHKVFSNLKKQRISPHSKIFLFFQISKTFAETSWNLTANTTYGDEK